MGVTSFIDMTGKRCGRLTVIRRDIAAGSPTRWVCRCDCGREISTYGKLLRSGHSGSCGCLKRDRTIEHFTTHGESHSREYRAWSAAKTRCYNTKLSQYRDYGGRGIVMEEPWRSDYTAFLHDMGRCPVGYTLDRINNDGPYAPGNCRWAARTTQTSNTRQNRYLTHNGHTLAMSEWSRRSGIPYYALKMRLNRGWAVDKALTTPPREQRPYRRQAC